MCGTQHPPGERPAADASDGSGGPGESHLGRTNSPRAALLACFVLLAVGCVPRMEPIIQSCPSVFRGTPNLVLLPVDYRELWVDDLPASDYLATRSDEQRARFLEDLAMADAEFRARLGERLGPAVVPFQSAGVLTVRAWFERWEPGEWFSSDAEAQLLVSVFNDRGREVERVRLSAHEVANVVNPTATDRLRSCVRKLADRTAQYMDERGR